MPNSRRPSPSSRRAAASSPTKPTRRATAAPANKPTAGSCAAPGGKVAAAADPACDGPAPVAEASGAGRPIVELKNLGPATAEWLAEVGIHEQGELARLGSLEAFRLITGYLRKRGEPAPTLNLLFALEGALSDTHWARLPGVRRRELQEQGMEVLRAGSSS